MAIYRITTFGIPVTPISKSPKQSGVFGLIAVSSGLKRDQIGRFEMGPAKLSNF